MNTGDLVAIFNRVYTGNEKGTYVVEFNKQLEFYKKNDKLYSNMYDIILNANMNKSVFYKSVQDILNIKLENNELKDVMTYTKEEWDKLINE